jgi:hypothetical protein
MCLTWCGSPLLTSANTWSSSRCSQPLTRVSTPLCVALSSSASASPSGRDDRVCCAPPGVSHRSLSDRRGAGERAGGMTDPSRERPRHAWSRPDALALSHHAVRAPSPGNDTSWPSPGPHHATPSARRSRAAGRGSPRQDHFHDRLRHCRLRRRVTRFISPENRPGRRTGAAAPTRTPARTPAGSWAGDGRSHPASRSGPTVRRTSPRSRATAGSRTPADRPFPNSQEDVAVEVHRGAHACVARASHTPRLLLHEVLAEVLGVAHVADRPVERPGPGGGERDEPRSMGAGPSLERGHQQGPDAAPS